LLLVVRSVVHLQLSDVLCCKEQRPLEWAGRQAVELAAAATSMLATSASNSRQVASSWHIQQHTALVHPHTCLAAHIHKQSSCKVGWLPDSTCAGGMLPALGAVQALLSWWPGMCQCQWHDLHHCPQHKQVPYTGARWATWHSARNAGQGGHFLQQQQQQQNTTVHRGSSLLLAHIPSMPLDTPMHIHSNTGVTPAAAGTAPHWHAGMPSSAHTRASQTGSI
jgi:hypothetical protein